MRSFIMEARQAEIWFEHMNFYVAMKMYVDNIAFKSQLTRYIGIN